MLATLIVEVGLVIWILARDKVGKNRRLIILMLVCLAVFQLAEFNVCRGSSGAIWWSHLGYSFITLLPILGIDLGLRIIERRSRLIWLAYGAALALILSLSLVPASLNASVCTGNYVIFRLSPVLGLIWSQYYLVMIVIGLLIALIGTLHLNARKRQASLWLAFAYISFTVPSYLIYYLLPSASLGLPSIMCGFAIIFALILTLKVSPLMKA
jgi:hypothetical protein